MVGRNLASSADRSLASLADPSVARNLALAGPSAGPSVGSRTDSSVAPSAGHSPVASAVPLAFRSSCHLALAAFRPVLVPKGSSVHSPDYSYYSAHKDSPDDHLKV